jgi:hypothetical protein
MHAETNRVTVKQLDAVAVGRPDAAATLSSITVPVANTTVAARGTRAHVCVESKGVSNDS